jgi:hypothetical protein
MSILIKGNSGSGGSAGSSKGYPVGNVNILAVRPRTGSVLIKWEDPEDCVYDNITFSKWAGTLIVRKLGSAPESIKDGDIVLDNTIKNKYKDSYFTDNNVINGNTYYYRFFPYTDNKVYNTDFSNIVKASPGSYSEIFGENSLDQIHTAIEDGSYKEIWKVGDKIKIWFNQSPTMNIQGGSKTYSFTTPAGYVEFAIADFDKKTRWTDSTVKTLGPNTTIPSYNSTDQSKNIILVQSEACVNGQPLFFKTVGYADDNQSWVYTGRHTYADRFTRQCDEFLRDYTKEESSKYFDEIDYCTYYSGGAKNPDDGWNHTLSINQYISRQKFFRIDYTFVIKYNLALFTDNASRIFKTAEGVAKQYLLFQDCYSYNTAGNNGYITTNGNYQNIAPPIWSNESARIICALK